MSRNTVQQKIIFDIVKNMRTHPSPDEVYREVHNTHPTIGRATVYRVLNKLADSGQIQKVNMPKTADRFDYRTDKHIHFYCNCCSKVFDTDIENGSDIIAGLSDQIRAENHTSQQGFEISDLNIFLEGLCPSCRENIE